VRCCLAQEVGLGGLQSGHRHAQSARFRQGVAADRTQFLRVGVGLEEDGVAASSKQLLRVSRMLRNRVAYEERFGTIAYEFMLTDCLWGVYQMIGKLNPGSTCWRHDSGLHLNTTRHDDLTRTAPTAD